MHMTLYSYCDCYSQRGTTTGNTKTDKVPSSFFIAIPSNLIVLSIVTCTWEV